MTILHYDEFGIYTTIEDIEKYIENLVISGETDDVIYDKCIITFGEMFSKTIDDILYEN